MCKLLIHVILLYSIILTKYILCDEPSLHEHTADDFTRLKITRSFKMRCTRRFSPGVCASQVSPVWTFVFQQQDCVERLGCANSFRANRFLSYEMCMKNCRGLIEMYLEMLRSKNSTETLRKGLPKKLPKPLIRIKDLKDPSPLDSEDIAYELPQYEHIDNETHSIVYKDILDTAEIFPPDVDQVDGKIRSKYDLLHPYYRK